MHLTLYWTTINQASLWMGIKEDILEPDITGQAYYKNRVILDLMICSSVLITSLEGMSCLGEGSSKNNQKVLRTGLNDETERKREGMEEEEEKRMRRRGEEYAGWGGGWEDGRRRGGLRRGRGG